MRPTLLAALIVSATVLTPTAAHAASTDAARHISICKGYPHAPVNLGGVLFSDGNVSCPADGHNTGTVVQVEIIEEISFATDPVVGRGAVFTGCGAGCTTYAYGAVSCQGHHKYYTRLHHYLTGPYGRSVPTHVNSYSSTLC